MFLRHYEAHLYFIFIISTESERLSGFPRHMPGFFLKTRGLLQDFFIDRQYAFRI